MPQTVSLETRQSSKTSQRPTIPQKIGELSDIYINSSLANGRPIFSPSLPVDPIVVGDSLHPLSQVALAQHPGWRTTDIESCLHAALDLAVDRRPRDQDCHLKITNKRTSTHKQLTGCGGCMRRGRMTASLGTLSRFRFFLVIKGSCQQELICFRLI